MSTINVPFCRLPNSKYQSFDMTTCQRSPEQVATLLEVSQRPEFAYFVVTQSINEEYIISPEYSCEFHCMWYDTEGWMNYGTIHENGSVEWRKATTKSDPVNYDCYVYQTRIQ